MSQRCYRKWSGGIFDASSNDDPCPNQTPSIGGFVGCCGKGDACLADGLCFYNHTQDGGSGLYTQACTDSTYGDTACNQHCSDQAKSDVVFNGTNNVWACCSGGANGNPDCANPTNETFSASPFWPFLVNAQAVATGGNGGQSSATKSIFLVNASSTAKSTIPTCASEGSSLSTGAKAGIGVGFAIAGLIILGFALWVLLLSRAIRRLKREQRQLMTPNTAFDPSIHREKTELSASQYTAEIDSSHTPLRSELSQ